MDWLTHQFRQLIKGSWYKRQMSTDFHFQPLSKHEIIDQKTYPVNPFSTTQNNYVIETHGGYHLRLIVTFIVGQPVL